MWRRRINRDHTYINTRSRTFVRRKKQTQVDSNNVKSYVNPNKSHLPKRNSKDKTKLTCGFAFALSSSASNVLCGIQTFQINRLLFHFLLFNLFCCLGLCCLHLFCGVAINSLCMNEWMNRKKNKMRTAVFLLYIEGQRRKILNISSIVNFRVV